MQDFRNFEVWKLAHRTTLSIYRVTAKFPAEEKYGLVSQLRRAAASIPTNLAEGCGRGSDSDFGRFVQIALGSAFEVDYQLLLAKDLGYLPPKSGDPIDLDIQAIKRMLQSLLRKLRGN